ATLAPPAHPYMIDFPEASEAAGDSPQDSVVFWSRPGDGEELIVHAWSTSFEKLGEEGVFTHLAFRTDSGSLLSGWVENVRLTDNGWGDAIGESFAPCGKGKSGIGEGEV